MDKYTIYISFIVFVKFALVCLAITHLYLKLKKKTDSELDQRIVYFKEKFEFIFIALMSCLLIYLFNPRIDRSDLINRETKLVLYLFGFILLITAKWDSFFKETIYFQQFQSIV
jgi:hypothetical protein